MFDSGSFPSKARHQLLHLKALGLCPVPSGAMGLCKQRGPSSGGLCRASTLVSTNGPITRVCTINLSCQSHQTSQEEKQPGCELLSSLPSPHGNLHTRRNEGWTHLTFPELGSKNVIFPIWMSHFQLGY